MTPTTLLQTTTYTFLLALALTVIYMMLVRKINLKGLLHDQNKNISPGRVQALVVTLMGCGSYLMLLSNHHDSSSLPSIPIALLALLGGSHSLYLAEKFTTKL